MAKVGERFVVQESSESRKTLEKVAVCLLLNSHNFLSTPKLQKIMELSKLSLNTLSKKA